MSWFKAILKGVNVPGGVMTMSPGNVPGKIPRIESSISIMNENN